MTVPIPPHPSVSIYRALKDLEESREYRQTRKKLSCCDDESAKTADSDYPNLKRPDGSWVEIKLQ